MKVKSNFKTGIIVLLPLLVFVWLIEWLYKTLYDFSTNILDMIPMSWISQDVSIPIYWHLIVLIAVVVIIWLMGTIANHYYIGEKLKKIIRPIIKKIPILKTLFRISRQAGDTLTKKGAFKEAVLVEYPTKGVYTIGYITRGNIEPFEEVLSKPVVSVFFPTAPNTLNGFVQVVEKDKIISSKAETQSTIEFIVSMGTIDVKYVANKQDLVL